MEDDVQPCAKYGGGTYVRYGIGSHHLELGGSKHGTILSIGHKRDLRGL